MSLQQQYVQSMHITQYKASLNTTHPTMDTVAADLSLVTTHPSLILFFTRASGLNTSS